MCFCGAWGLNTLSTTSVLCLRTGSLFSCSGDDDVCYNLIGRSDSMYRAGLEGGILRILDDNWLRLRN